MSSDLWAEWFTLLLARSSEKMISKASVWQNRKGMQLFCKAVQLMSASPKQTRRGQQRAASEVAQLRRHLCSPW